MHEQPKPTGKGQSVTAEVRKLLDQREAKGIATYGTTLRTHNGRDALRDLTEELLDAVQYAVQLRMEESDLRSSLRDICAICERDGAASLAEREKQWAHDLCEIAEIASNALNK